MQGWHYLKKGINLSFSNGNLPFVVIPIIVNMALFALTISWIVNFAASYAHWLTNFVPTWLNWLEAVIYWLSVIIVVMLYAISFTMLANLIASPFYGVLSERVAYQLGYRDAGNPTLVDVIKTIPAAMGRELVKIGYYLPRALAVWIIGLFLPAINIFIWFAFNAWMQSIQYLDYPFDNSLKPFNDVKRFAAKKRGFALHFGSLLQIASMIPLANLVIMPAAVCAGTAYWFDHADK